MIDEIAIFELEVTGVAPDFVRAEYDGKVRTFKRKAAAGRECIVYCCELTVGWVCFVFGDTEFARFEQMERVIVTAILLTPDLRRALQISPAGGNLTDVLQRRLQQ